MPQDYPIPRYHFQIDWGGSKLSFTEVTGLVMEREKIEYRHSDSLDFSKIAMPGLVKNTNIVMKRGKFVGDFDFKSGRRSQFTRSLVRAIPACATALDRSPGAALGSLRSVQNTP